MESVLSGREVLESSKLQGASNYALWSYKIRTILQGEKLWFVVDPDITPAAGTPRPTADSGDSSNINTATIARTPVPTGAATAPSAPLLEGQRNEDLRYRVTRIIVPTVRDSIMPHIMHIDDP